MNEKHQTHTVLLDGDTSELIRAMTKRLLAALLIPACLSCAGCDGTSEESDTEPEVQTSSDVATEELSNGCYDADHYLRECEIKLHDGRKVTCIMNVFNSDEGGLSCDWNHATKTETKTQ